MGSIDDIERSIDVAKYHSFKLFYISVGNHRLDGSYKRICKIVVNDLDHVFKIIRSMYVKYNSLKIYIGSRFHSKKFPFYLNSLYQCDFFPVF